MRTNTGQSDPGWYRRVACVCAAFALVLQLTAGCSRTSKSDAGAPESVRRELPASEGSDPERRVSFAQALLRDAAEATDAVGLDEAARERELRYARRWITRLLPQRVLDELELGDAEFRCVSGIGPRGDDAVLYGGVVGDTRVELIDSRVLVLVVTSESGLHGVESVFEEFVDYGSRVPRVSVRYRTEDPGDSALGPMGTVEVDRGNAPGWFAPAIAWHVETGGRHVFVVVKELVVPSTKVPLSLDRAPMFVDGIPVDDPRTYRRFVDGNREELSRERFPGLRRPGSGDGALGDGESKGVPIGLERDR